MAFPWGQIPITVSGPLPPDLPVPFDFVFQELALSGGAGNTSNCVGVRVE